jgi:hypothetical protein
MHSQTSTFSPPWCELRRNGALEWHFFTAKLKLSRGEGRNAMLVLTDGWDTGSNHGLIDSIRACQRSEAVVYAIRTTDPAILSAWPLQLARGKSDLARIARETGGLCFDGSRAQLADVFDRIEADLSSQYVLGYGARRYSGELSVAFRAIEPSKVLPKKTLSFS